MGIWSNTTYLPNPVTLLLPFYQIILQRWPRLRDVTSDVMTRERNCLAVQCNYLESLDVCTVVDRAFPVSAARVWNAGLPPAHVASSPSLHVFKAHLKTVLLSSGG